MENRNDVSVGLLIMLIPSVVVGLLFCVYKGAGLLEVERTKCLEAGGIYLRTYEGLRCVKDNEIIDVRPIKE